MGLRRSGFGSAVIGSKFASGRRDHRLDASQPERQLIHPVDKPLGGLPELQSKQPRHSQPQVLDPKAIGLQRDAGRSPAASVFRYLSGCHALPPCITLYAMHCNTEALSCRISAYFKPFPIGLLTPRIADGRCAQVKTFPHIRHARSQPDLCSRRQPDHRLTLGAALSSAASQVGSGHSSNSSVWPLLCCTRHSSTRAVGAGSVGVYTRTTRNSVGVCGAITSGADARRTRVPLLYSPFASTSCAAKCSLNVATPHVVNEGGIIALRARQFHVQTPPVFGTTTAGRVAPTFDRSPCSTIRRYCAALRSALLVLLTPGKLRSEGINAASQP